MKKILAILLAAMLMFGAVACTNNDANDTDTNTNTDEYANANTDEYANADSNTGDLCGNIYSDSRPGKSSGGRCGM
jgi:uncharacterized low-complexity protein